METLSDAYREGEAQAPCSRFSYPADLEGKASSMNFPFAPAEKYAWPGGYPIGYVMDDSEMLCGDCMNEPSNPVHAGGEADGWRLEGLQVLEDPSEEEHCAQCLTAFHGS